MKAKRDEDKPKPAKVKKDIMSNASSLLKQEFAEDSREDEEDSDQVSDEEEKKSLVPLEDLYVAPHGFDSFSSALKCWQLS